MEIGSVERGVSLFRVEGRVYVEERRGGYFILWRIVGGWGVVLRSSWDEMGGAVVGRFG